MNDDKQLMIAWLKKEVFDITEKNICNSRQVCHRGIKPGSYLFFEIQEEIHSANHSDAAQPLLTIAFHLVPVEQTLLVT